jgi:DNA-binding CsgD family transcriptional regulator
MGYGRDVLIERAAEAGSVRELFGTASPRLRRLVDFDAAVWLATDPATGLPTAPTHLDNLAHFGRGPCERVWELEFLVEDVNLYRDLAGADVPAGALRLSTDDRPARSHRFRDLLRPNGFGDELRAVLRTDGRPWAVLSLFREAGRPAFSAAERALAGGLSAPLAGAIRDLTRAQGAEQRGPVPGPGLLLFDGRGKLISLNDDAGAWLDELNADHWDQTDDGVRLPMVVLTTLMHARAIAEEREHGQARVRLRGGSGYWIVCHASCLRTVDGEIGETALVIESAPADEVAPIIAEAYELSAREREVTEWIARGASTAQIAEQLVLSPHTVRDYIKAIFEKVGVSSRGELVARLFSEHYAPIHFDPAQLIA